MISKRKLKNQVFGLFVMMLILTLSFACTWPSYAAEEGLFKTILKERLAEKSKDKDIALKNASVQTQISQSGDYVFSIPYDGFDRKYLVHVPEKYSPQKPAPMILAYHGGGGHMEYMANDDYYGLITKSDREGFIVVFPNGYSKFKSGKFATWNAGECCGDARDKKIDDVGFSKKIVSNLKHQMNIDPDKIYAIGMSNGGMMAHRLACEAADIFKAVASVTGTESTLSCHPSRPISVLHIHALNDTHVLFNGGAGKGSFKDPSKVTDFTSVPETIARWVSRDRCTNEKTRVLEVSGAYCDLYASCSDTTQVKLCVTETGQHSWPGGKKPRADEQPSQAISANDEIWNFFQSLK
ncbi:MAG: prolyl oligopeptidase family serine peptidase [Alphaproteobacteria bacterium]|nr:prolyl oligopeptidase family serine peptidase [Alphaproteobacteria bacterium]MCB9985619.1 prolyl oligopeptidase family serine peptidase [Micavibrio sp.]